MNIHRTEEAATRAHPSDDIGDVFFALAVASVYASLLLTFSLWIGFVWPFYPVIFVITFGVAVVVGLPLYFVARLLGRIDGWSAALAGSATALLLPALLLLSDDVVPGWPRIATLIAFAVGGASAGLGFFQFLRRKSVPRGRRRKMTAITACTAVAAFGFAWTAQDHSCHNPVWYGQGIAPSGAFELAILLTEWRALADEATRFGQAREWSIRTDAAFEPERPWFKMSTCDAAGTDIELWQGADQKPFAIYAFQAQGGDSWRQPLIQFHDRLQSRWPGALRYRDALGKSTSKQPDWLFRAAKAPPAAR